MVHDMIIKAEAVVEFPIYLDIDTEDYDMEDVNMLVEELLAEKARDMVEGASFTLMDQDWKQVA